MFADPLFTGAAVSMRMLQHFQAGNVPQLPYTRREAERTVRLTPKPRNLLALGARANRTAAMDPSALLLSFENEKHEPEDGFLRVYDIYDLRFNADLVVLSACQAGLGNEVRGEGLVGLPRAFLYAEASRVVVSPDFSRICSKNPPSMGELCFDTTS